MVNVAQQPADRARIRDGWIVLGLPRRKGATQIPARITVGAGGSHGIPEDLPAVLLDTMRCLEGAAFLHALEEAQQVGRSDRPDRLAADPRKHVALEAPQDLFRVRVGPARGVLRVPLACDRFEGVQRRQTSRRAACCLAPGGDLLARSLAKIARIASAPDEAPCVFGLLAGVP
jgi:hypothetical protein